mmetsp:Transcript_45240/g.107878  ORF Transcript_45240/g.107878 Transcript_45240/m.107878 type:complete len:505 (-) Transcript_45240:147-1661(-)
MSEVPRYGYRIKVCSSSTRGGSRGKRGLEEGRDILKLLRAEVVLHSRVALEDDIGDPQLLHLVDALGTPLVEHHRVSVAMPHQERRCLDGVGDGERRARQPRAQRDHPGEGLIGSHAEGGSVGDGPALREPREHDPVARHALGYLVLDEGHDVRGARENAFLILPLVLRIEGVEVKPRRHLHAHVERHGQHGRCRVQELDVRHVQLRRHWRPPEPAVAEAVHPDDRGSVLVALRHGMPLHQLPVSPRPPALEGSGDESVSGQPPVHPTLSPCGGRRSGARGTGRGRGGGGGRCAREQRVVVASGEEHPDRFLAHPGSAARRKRVLHRVPPRGGVVLLVDGDVAPNGARKERELDLPSPRPPGRHLLSVDVRGHAGLPLDPLSERRAVELRPRMLRDSACRSVAEVGCRVARVEASRDRVEHAGTVARHSLADPILRRSETRRHCRSDSGLEGDGVEATQDRGPAEGNKTSGGARADGPRGGGEVFDGEVGKCSCLGHHSGDARR